MFKFNELPDFDKHIANSNPNYNGLIELVHGVAKDYVQQGSTVYDIGCSSGSLLNSLRCYGAKLYGVDVVDIRKHEDFDFIMSSGTDALKSADTIDVIFSIFTAQFMGLGRSAYFDELTRHINDGAVCFFAEKVILDDNKLNSVVQKNLLAHKRKSFTDTEILDKEEALSGVMHPLTNSQLNTAFLDNVDATEVWQSYNFKCYFLQSNK